MSESCSVCAFNAPNFLANIKSARPPKGRSRAPIFDSLIRHYGDLITFELSWQRTPSSSFTGQNESQTLRIIEKLSPVYPT